MFLLASISLLLVACSKDASSKEKDTIIIGTSPGPYSELFIEGVIPILKDRGYEVEITSFSDLLSANTALIEGAVDLSVDQHTAYMKNFNKERGSNLVAITPIPTVAAGIFPGVKKSLDDLAEGDKIGIPKDPSNAARAYALLQKAGIIQLKDDIELVKATADDIIDNPKNVEILEMDSAQIPRSLVDIDYGIIPGSIVYSSNLDPSTKLLAEDVLKDLELVAVVNGDNKDTKWSKAVVEAYRSDQFKSFLAEQNKDDYWFVPEELR